MEFSNCTCRENYIDSKPTAISTSFSSSLFSFKQALVFTLAINLFIRGGLKSNLNVWSGVFTCRSQLSSYFLDDVSKNCS